ncbi:hypothetical protein [Pseudonocardia sp. MH-G8]|uniref:hypothetical protein n=1 Tax=Pseudonocardia sp. MH-G8 TaxID=1854588 RepID=UPI000BA08331|nr:hypothetical protein [Pseudonocardia sp. MH-G8]OZM78078.1 hypothetical protein CFP66_32485 [Pseudonocardia sp. MH-G8]
MNDNRFERIEATTVQVAQTINNAGSAPTVDPAVAGLALLETDQYALAARRFEEALGMRPADARVHFWRAVALLQGRRPRRHSGETLDRVTAHLRAARELPEARVLHALIIEDHQQMRRRSATPPADVLELVLRITSESAELIRRHVPARETRMWSALESRQDERRAR